MFEELLDLIVKRKLHFNFGGKQGILNKLVFLSNKEVYEFDPANLIFNASMVKEIKFTGNGAFVTLKEN